MTHTSASEAIPIMIFAAYFMPSFMASYRRHHQLYAIIALNFLLGWTGLGWIAAFIWACTHTRQTSAS